MSKKSKNIQKARKNQPAVKQSTDIFSRMEDQMKSLEKRFDDFLTKGWMAPFDSEWPESLMAGTDLGMPKVDIIDKGKKLVVRAEVPGFDKDNIDVTVTDTSVTIKGDMKEESSKEEGDFYQSETRQGSFSRSMALPAEVDSAKAKAKFKNGILEIKLPKRKDEKKQKVSID